MKINLWYCKEMKMWRWTLMDDRDSTSKWNLVKDQI